MKLTTITLSYQRTESLPDYCNVRPSLSLTADLDPRESAGDVITDLDAQITSYVHDKIDDAREEANLRPKFYVGPLYRLCRWEQAQMLVILPDDDAVCRDLPGDWTKLRNPARLATLGDIAYGQSSLDVLDCSLGDLGDIWAWWNERQWYRPYVLLFAGGDIGRILVVNETIAKPPRLQSLGAYWQRPDWRPVARLDELIARLNDDSSLYQIWTIVERPTFSRPATIPCDRILIINDDSELAAYVADWNTTHSLERQPPAGNDDESDRDDDGDDESDRDDDGDDEPNF